MRRATRSLTLLGLFLGMGVASAAPPRTVTLAVQNMNCGTCPIVVRKALERVSGVSATSVDFEKKTATVTFDPDKASTTQLAEATTNAGFPSKILTGQ